MTIRWLLLRASSLPEGDDWLGANERRVLAGLGFPKRRFEWRLGRYTAKRALSDFAEVDDLSRMEVIAAKDGAPEAFIDDQGIDACISISHREQVAACVIAPNAKVGCDLEAIEPRSRRFVADFFTEREGTRLDGTADGFRDRHVALTWSAKESALKLLRVGLRRDTRSVEVEIEDPEAAEPDWHPFRVTISPENWELRGWWRQDEDLVLTVVSDPRDRAPIP